MSYPINYPTPENANFQAFYKSGDWVKPKGAAMVRMLLIGAGGGGACTDATNSYAGGGGSGAVTSWIGPAMFIPDVLQINVGVGGAGGTQPFSSGLGANGTASTVVYQLKNSIGYTLLTASGGGGGSNGGFGTGGSGGAASTNNNFGASGIFNSIAGQNGGDSTNDVVASGQTFLSGGAGGGGNGGPNGFNVFANYGYSAKGGTTSSVLAGTVGGSGLFLLSPVMVGVGGAGGGGSSALGGGNGGNGGIGCGGGGGGRPTTGITLGGNGGDGAVFIWSW